MMRVLLAIVQKELTDGLRDRRAVISAFSFPLFTPLLIAWMLHSLATSSDDPLEMAVLGADRAPGLIAFIENQGFDLQDPPADPEAAVRDGELDVVLVIDEGYGEDFRAGRPAKVKLMLDDSQDAARAGIGQARALLRAYAGHIGAMRLLARGVNPELVQPVQLDEQDLGNPRKRAASLLDMITMFVVLGAFVCSMYIAIEAAAGERERKSLEPLLLNPVPRWLLVAGKWLAAVIFGLVGVVFTLACLVVIIRQVSLESLGFRVVLDWPVAVSLLLITAPLAPLAGAMQLLIASFTRSFKEAQLYISLSLTLPMLPGLIFSLKPMKTAEWMNAVPLLGQQVMGTQLLRGEGITWTQYWIATSASLALTALLLWITVRLFERERMVFGGSS